MKSALLIIAACLVILLLPATLSAINEFRMAEHTELHVIATTNQTTGTATLTQDLFNDSVVNVSFSSNNTADAPLATGYTAATKVLAIDGLQTSATRTLSITYKIDALTDYVGTGTAVKIWPIFLVLGVIGLVIGGVYNATKHGD